MQRRWSNPGHLRNDLIRLVGAVENPTAASDIDVRFTPPPRVAASGVVPRLQLPGGTRAVKIEPQLSEQPYYVKLRAEVDQGLLDDGIGKLYLGFHLDPLYHVHWNNLVDPLRYRIRTTDGVTIVPRRGEGPKVEEAADVDPREFLLDIERDMSDQDRFLRRRRQQDAQPQQLLVSVDYFACNDEEGWCKPVTQEYVVTLALDGDGGWAMSRRGGAGGRGNSGGTASRGNARGGGIPGGGRNPGAGAVPAGANRIMGGVFAVDLKQRTLTIRQRSGDSITLQLGQDVPIIRNGQPATLADLQMRDMVMAIITEGEGKNPTVVRLMTRTFGRGGR